MTERDGADRAAELAARVDAVVEAIEGITTRPRGRAIGRIGANIGGGAPLPNSVVERGEAGWSIAVDIAIAGLSAPAAAATVAERLSAEAAFADADGGRPEVTVRVVDVSSAPFSGR